MCEPLIEIVLPEIPLASVIEIGRQLYHHSPAVHARLYLSEELLEEGELPSHRIVT